MFPFKNKHCPSMCWDMFFSRKKWLSSPHQQGLDLLSKKKKPTSEVMKAFCFITTDVYVTSPWYKRLLVDNRSVILSSNFKLSFHHPCEMTIYHKTCRRFHFHTSTECKIKGKILNKPSQYSFCINMCPSSAHAE